MGSQDITLNRIVKEGLLEGAISSEGWEETAKAKNQE